MGSCQKKPITDTDTDKRGGNSDSRDSVTIWRQNQKEKPGEIADMRIGA